MEKPAAFDLNRALHHWRTQLADSSSVNRENLDELETHLRDSVARLCQAGLSEQEGWIITEMRFGQTKALGEEFEKIQPPVLRRRLSEKQFIGALLGGFALLTGVFLYFDPPTDFLAWMDRVSEPRTLRQHLFERYGLAPPSAHDLKVACLAVAAFLAGTVFYIFLRDRQRSLRTPRKTQPRSA